MATIEEEIKQKKFNNEYHRLLINVMFTASWLSGLQGGLFKTYKLTAQQYNTLRILRGQHPEACSVNVLKERMIDKMSNVSRIIDKLKDKQLVTRKPCKNDRRQVDVKITESGLKMLLEIDEAMLHWEKELHTISEEEARQANAILDRWRG